MRKMVLFFEEITKKDLPLVGGKSANLGEMFNKINVPVLGGFTTTSDAYRYFLEKNELWPKISKELKKIKDPTDTKTLKKVGKKIGSLILKAKMPEDLKDEIKKAYEEMGKKFVAVRSSATAEDLPGASFAGQQETYLNVKGARNVVKAVQKCYASLFTDRAIFYRIQKGFSHKKVALSAAVQEMIDSFCSGVIFTLDVRNGDRSKIVIEGSWGLGECVVQGKVTPDDFFVRKRDLKILEKMISKKTIMLKNKKDGGTVEKPVPKAMQKKPVLSDSEIRKLSKYAIEIEKHYRFSQDIEWVKDKSGRFFILQSRPETAWTSK